MPMDVNAVIRRISEELELANLAQRDARNNLPRDNATALTEAEQQAENAARVWGRKEATRLSEHCQKTEDTVRRFEEALQKLRHLRQNPNMPPSMKEDLKSAQSSKQNAEAAYNQFKHDNNLTRDATDDDRTAQIVFALALAAGEGLVNMFFFAPVTSGKIEAFLYAFVIGGSNVFFAFLGAALGLRYASHHRDPTKKFMGLAWFFICLSVCASVVMLSTWFRGHVDLLGGGLQHSVHIANLAWINSMESMRTFDFAGLFSSIQSFLLVLLGTIFAILGIWKGYQYDDPYPGFGAMWRTKENHEQHYRGIQKRWEEWQRRHEIELRQRREELEQAKCRAEVDLRGAQRSRDRASCLPENIRDVVRGLFAAYREPNRRIRVAPEPAYFNEYPTAAQFSGTNALYRECDGRIEKAQAEFDKLSREIQGAIGGA